ncbi:oxidoreductase family protein [Biscogniauxia marginata]|nr:oxidoreductase family protein [Biscogniauxia marginata]
MAPIRVALIGLSASAKTSWAEEGHLPYLLSPLGRSHYVIVALLNSSAQAAEAAREYYKLPISVKTYGSPEQLAADEEVDLVVCNTRTDKHVSTTVESLRAGKAAFIEWPLAANYKEAIALTGGQQFDNSIIGLQGRFSPIVLKVKEALKSGRIGRVLSSEVRAYGNLWPRDGLPERLSYFSDRKIGGNGITIPFAHTIDHVHDTLGEFENFQSRMQIQRPGLKILDRDGTPKGEVKTDVPDFLAVHGKLAKGKADIVEGATLVFTYRTGPQFKGTPGLVWTINGEKGEIMVTACGAYIGAHAYHEPIDIKVHDHATDEVVNIEWDWEDWQKELPTLARNVAQLYERFARWRESGRLGGDVPEGEEWPRLHEAVVRMKEFEELLRQYDSQDGGM